MSHPIQGDPSIERLHDLITAHECGEITRDELTELESNLLHSAYARKVYMRRAFDAVDLHWHAHRDEAAEQGDDPLVDLSAGAEHRLQNLLEQQTAQPKSTDASPMPLRGWIAAVIAMGITIGVFFATNQSQLKSNSDGETHVRDNFVIALPVVNSDPVSGPLVRLESYANLLSDE